MGKFLKWLFAIEEDKPQFDDEGNTVIGEGIIVSNSDIDDDDKPQELTIKEATFDVSKIKSYTGEKIIDKATFRPQTFDQFIGQENNKKRILLNIDKIKMGIKTHFFFDAIQGHGKTTMAYLIAKELDAKIIERVGQQICDEDLVNIINEINASKEKYVVFFIDEIETLKPKFCKTLNTILEDFNVAGKDVKPFIFIGATINKYLLMKRSPDTLDRISAQIRFNRYTKEEIERIMIQYSQKLYSKYEIPANAIYKIASNCKFSPRISTDMLGDYVVIKDADKLLEYRDIVKDGLTGLDVKIIKVLQSNVKPMGAEALSQKVGITTNDYIKIYEPYLVEMNYIQRTPRRQIDVKGVKLLEELK